MSRFVLALVVGLALLLAGRSAFAQKDAQKSVQKDDAAERARVHFQNGVRLYDAKPPDYNGALAEFRAAYRDKPSPGIKQNIALCHKAEKRYPEAVDALTEMLAEGGDSIKPPVREAATKAIAEMSALIATVHLYARVKMVTLKAPRSLVVFTLDGAPLTDSAFTKPIRLGAGEHLFTAHADGYTEAAKRVTLEGGQRDVDVGLDLEEVVAFGTLTVRANVAAAQIKMDGVILATGTWSGQVRAGVHRVDVFAEGYTPYALEVPVAANESNEYPVELARPREAPQPYAQEPAPRKPEEKIWYLMGGLDIQAEALRLSSALDEPASGSARTFTGAAAALKVGRRVSRFLSVELDGGVGTMSPSTYQSPKNHSVAANTSLTNWVLGSMVRFQTVGSPRLVVGAGIGLQGQSVKASLAEATAAGAASASTDHTASGVSGIGMAEAGAQFDLGKLFLDATLFGNVLGVAGVQDSAGNRFFLDSPALRGGVRALLGYAF